MTVLVKQRIEAFGQVLEHVLGDNLVSFLVYGPAARDQETKEIMSLLVVKDASPAALRPVEPEIAHWTARGAPAPLIFSEREFRNSADVFPIEIEEMRSAHFIVRGTDPLEHVRTDPEDLRQELEREVRGKLLRLRTEFAAAAPNGRRLANLLADSAATFFVLFRALLRLTGTTPPDNPRQLVEETARIANLDVSAFEWVVDAAEQVQSRRLEPFDPVGDHYVEQIGRLARFIDSLDRTKTKALTGE